MSLLLTATNLKKSYGSNTILNGLNLSVEKNEMITITGASGAGKSTLLQLLGTLDHPDSGGIKIFDTDISSLSAHQLASFRNRHIGFVFQAHHLLPDFTVLENIMMPALIAKQSKEKAKLFAMELMNKLGIDHRAHHQPHQLSGGEQQRTAVARALINKPSLVLADEPSGNLDSTNANQLQILFKELNTALQTTFIIVTHNVQLANSAGKCYQLSKGKLENINVNTKI
jgi:lipoprotein-releasing system ATP-binding protein